MHITQLFNEYFNGNVEHVSTDRVRRTTNTAQFGYTPPQTLTMSTKLAMSMRMPSLLGLFF